MPRKEHVVWMLYTVENGFVFGDGESLVRMYMVSAGHRLDSRWKMSLSAVPICTSLHFGIVEVKLVFGETDITEK